MTNEEAIEILQEEHDYCQEMSYVIKALEMAIEALEKAVKFKWHDVQNDKSDMPDPEMPYAVVVLFYLWFDPNTAENEVDMAMIGYDGFEWQYNVFGVPAVNWDNVIAWKYIESFEN